MSHPYEHVQTAGIEVFGWLFSASASSATRAGASEVIRGAPDFIHCSGRGRDLLTSDVHNRHGVMNRVCDGAECDDRCSGA